MLSPPTMAVRNTTSADNTSAWYHHFHKTSGVTQTHVYMPLPFATIWHATRSETFTPSSWVTPAIPVCDIGVRLFVGCLTSQQQASVSQGRTCSDKFTCCHTEIEVADPTFYLTQSQCTDTGPASPSADPITPGAWQGSHWSATFWVTGMTRPQKKSRRKRDSNPGSSALEADALTTRPTRRPRDEGCRLVRVVSNQGARALGWSVKVGVTLPRPDVSSTWSSLLLTQPRPDTTWAWCYLSPYRLEITVPVGWALNTHD